MASTEFESCWKIEAANSFTHYPQTDYAGLRKQVPDTCLTNSAALSTLVANTGFSPVGTGPINTVRARNISQVSDDMDWQEINGPGSLSTSPTSALTPDNEAFEDLLDSESLRNFYQFGDMEPRRPQDQSDPLGMSSQDATANNFVGHGAPPQTALLLIDANSSIRPTECVHVHAKAGTR
jgi:hypothetical protein